MVSRSYSAGDCILANILGGPTCMSLSHYSSIPGSANCMGRSIYLYSPVVSFICNPLVRILNSNEQLVCSLENKEDLSLIGSWRSLAGSSEESMLPLCGAGYAV